MDHKCHQKTPPKFKKGVKKSTAKKREKKRLLNQNRGPWEAILGKKNSPSRSPETLLGGISGPFWELFLKFSEFRVATWNFLVAESVCGSFFAFPLDFCRVGVPVALQNHGFYLRGIVKTPKIKFSFQELRRGQFERIFP